MCVREHVNLGQPPRGPDLELRVRMRRAGLVRRSSVLKAGPAGEGDAWAPAAGGGRACSSPRAAPEDPQGPGEGRAQTAGSGGGGRSAQRESS